MTDREKVIKGLEKAIQNFERYSGDEYGREYDYARVGVDVLEDAIALQKAQEAVDAVSVVHGEWKWSHGGECSECGFHNSNFDYRYCPNCGAKMDGERRDDDGEDA